MISKSARVTKCIAESCIWRQITAIEDSIIARHCVSRGIIIRPSDRRTCRDGQCRWRKREIGYTHGIT